MYRPAAGAMASRFAPAADDSANDGSKDGGAANRKAAGVQQQRQQQQHQDPKQRIKDVRSNAVDLKMFGRLTRETHEWHPASLLCRRFDLRDPYPKSALVGCAAGTKKSALNQFNSMDDGAPPPRPSARTGNAGASRTSAGGGGAVGGGFQAPPNRAPPGDPRLLEPVPNTVVEKMPDRPAMDIFKAIFSDSSSSSSDDDDDDDDDDGNDGNADKHRAGARMQAGAAVPTPALATSMHTSTPAYGAPPLPLAAVGRGDGSYPPTTHSAAANGLAHPPLHAPPGDPRMLQHRQQQHRIPPPRHVFQQPAGKTALLSSATPSLAETAASAASLALALTGAGAADGEEQKPLPLGLTAPLQRRQQHAAPKLTLVHTYADLTESRQQANAVADQAKAFAAAPAWSQPLPTADKVWAEEPSAGAAAAAAAAVDKGSSSNGSSKSSKDKKHKHKSKSKSKSKSKGKHKKKGKSKHPKSSSKLSFDASDEDSDSDLDVGHAALLAKVRAAGVVRDVL